MRRLVLDAYVSLVCLSGSTILVWSLYVHFPYADGLPLPAIAALALLLLPSAPSPDALDEWWAGWTADPPPGVGAGQIGTCAPSADATAGLT